MYINDEIFQPRALGVSTSAAQKVSKCRVALKKTYEGTSTTLVVATTETVAVIAPHAGVSLSKVCRASRILQKLYFILRSYAFSI
jgi:hypothetical protein